MGEDRSLNRRLTGQQFLLADVESGAGCILAGCGGGAQNCPKYRRAA